LKIETSPSSSVSKVEGERYPLAAYRYVIETTLAKNKFEQSFPQHYINNNHFFLNQGRVSK